MHICIYTYDSCDSYNLITAKVYDAVMLFKSPIFNALLIWREFVSLIWGWSGSIGKNLPFPPNTLGFVWVIYVVLCQFPRAVVGFIGMNQHSKSVLAL